MGIFYSDTIESANPGAYGIVKATHVTGHRTVATIEDLYAISDAILSASKTNEDNDAIGQKWYVVSESKEYKLISWAERKSASGWEAVSEGGTGGTGVVDSQMSDSSINPVQNKIIKKYVDERTNELNISALYPTNGIDGGNKYTLETAIAQVPAEYRVQGVKVTFTNENEDTETWEYKGGTWIATNFAEIDAKSLAVLQNETTPFSNIATFGINTGGSGIDKDEAYDVVKAIYLNGVPSDKNYFIFGGSDNSITVKSEDKTVKVTFKTTNTTGLTFIEIEEGKVESGDYTSCIGSIAVVDFSKRRNLAYTNKSYPYAALDNEKIFNSKELVNSYKLEKLKNADKDIEYLKIIQNSLNLVETKSGLLLVNNAIASSGSAKINTYDISNLNDGEIIKIKGTSYGGNGSQDVCTYIILGEDDAVIENGLHKFSGTQFIDTEFPKISTYKKLRICLMEGFECYNKLPFNPTDIIYKLDKETFNEHLKDYEILRDEVHYYKKVQDNSKKIGQILLEDGTMAALSSGAVCSYNIQGITKAYLKTEIPYNKSLKLAYATYNSEGLVVQKDPNPVLEGNFEGVVEFTEDEVELRVQMTYELLGVVITYTEVNLQDAIKEIQDKIAPSPISVTQIGDSTGGGLNNPYLHNYFIRNGITYYKENRGGEQTNCMGAYQGSMPILISDKDFRIPASGGVEFIPKSSLLKPNFLMSDYQTFAQFGTAKDQIGINPVTIKGVKGNLSSSQNVIPYGAVFYDTNGRVALRYRASDYANTYTQFEWINSNPPVKLKVCVNANTEEELQMNTGHIVINDVDIPLTVHLTIQGFYLNGNGEEVASDGYYCSEEIDISDYTNSFNKLYVDGLAVGIKILFTRLEDGEEVQVEQYYPIYSENYEKFKNSINIFYINNFYKTGRPIEEDWLYQAKILTDYVKGGKFIFANTHYMFSGYSEEEILKIENGLRSVFGNRYFSGYTYLKDSGIADAIKYGVLTAEQVSGLDWKQVFLTNSIDSGVPNTNYDVHQNKYASYLLVRKFIEIGIMLGYWPEYDYSYETLSQPY